MKLPLRPGRKTVTALGLVALLAVACGSPGEPKPAAAGSDGPRTTATAPETKAPDAIASSACTVGGFTARCGTLSVPEDRGKPRGRRISLRVVVVPAASARVEPDPLFVLAGGPGGAASEDAAWTPEVFRGVHATRDIVLVDQRGTGGSNRLVQPPLPDTTGLSAAQAKARSDAWRRSLTRRLGADPRFYTTSVAMEDLDEVRAALGYDLINLYGVSYGATAAQYYLRQHDEHVRAVVLDGGTLLDVPIFERMAASSQRALDLLFDRCAADRSCHQAFPRLREEFTAVTERLARRPVTLPGSDGTTGEPIVLDGNAFATAVHFLLVRESYLGVIPALVHASYHNDWHPVVKAIAEARAALRPAEPLVMASVIQCSEAWAGIDPARVRADGDAGYLEGAQVAGADDQAELCALLPPGVVPPDDAQPVSSAVPVLLLVGEADPQDPPENVADAPEQLPNSRTVVVPGQAHTVAHLGCMPTIVDAFVRAGTVNGLDVSCAATDVPLPEFRTTF